MPEASHPPWTPSHLGLLNWMALGEHGLDSNWQGRPGESGMTFLPFPSLYQSTRSSKHEAS